MISLVFLGAFVSFLSGLPPCLASGAGGFWIAASWRLAPLEGAANPLILLVGRLATVVFPFGSPAFRMNAAGAFLAALAVPAALSLLSQARPRFQPGPALWELEEKRRWATATGLAILLWTFSPPVWRAATGGLDAAARLFFPLVAFDLFLRWAAAPAPRGRAGVWAALAWGGALAVEPGAMLALPGLWALARAGALSSAPPAARSGARAARILAHGASALLLAAIAFLLPAVLLALASHPVNEVFFTTRGFLTQSFGEFHRPAAPGPALRAALLASAQTVAWAGAWLALGGLRAAHRRDRPRGRAVVFLWLATALLPALLPGPAGTALPALGSLWPAFLLAWGTAELSAKIPWARAAAFLLVPAVLIGGPIFADRSSQRPDASAGDLLRSLPPQSAFVWDHAATAGAIAYAQQVEGRRRDVEVASSPGEPGAGGLFLESPPAGEEETWIPAGFSVQSGPGPLVTPAAVSLGRVPLILSESPPAAETVRRARHRLGDAFLRLRTPDQAEEEYLKALAAGAGAETALALGRLLLDYGDGRRAAAALFRAAAEEPRSVEILDAWSAAEILEGRLLQAVRLLQQALRIDPQRGDLRERAAELHTRLAQPLEAALQWEALSALRPGDKTVLWRLAQAWTMAAEPVKAYRAGERYLSLSLTEEEQRNAEAFQKLLVEAIARRAENQAAKGSN